MNAMSTKKNGEHLDIKSFFNKVLKQSSLIPTVTVDNAYMNTHSPLFLVRSTEMWECEEEPEEEEDEASGERQNSSGGLSVMEK